MNKVKIMFDDKKEAEQFFGCWNESPNGLGVTGVRYEPYYFNPKIMQVKLVTCFAEWIDFYNENSEVEKEE